MRDFPGCEGERGRGQNRGLPEKSDASQEKPSTAQEDGEVDFKKNSRTRNVEVSRPAGLGFEITLKRRCQIGA